MGVAQQTKELEGKLRQIEGGVALGSTISLAILQLGMTVAGQRLSFGTFDPAMPVTNLAVYRDAVRLDARTKGSAYATRVATAYGIIQANHQPGKPFGPVIPHALSLDGNIDEIGAGQGLEFSVLFRTPETRALDEKYTVGEHRRWAHAAVSLPYRTTRSARREVLSHEQVMEPFQLLANACMFHSALLYRELDKFVGRRNYLFDCPRGIEAAVAAGHLARRSIVDSSKQPTEIVVPLKF